MALAGLIENRRQPEGWPNSLRVPEARWNVDRADKGQGYDRTHARDGHQPLTDFIVAREQENLLFWHGVPAPRWSLLTNRDRRGLRSRRHFGSTSNIAAAGNSRRRACTPLPRRATPDRA